MTHKYSGFSDVVDLTNRLHVAVRLFSNRSQMTSKCGKNKKVAHEAQPSVSLMFLQHSDVLCNLLLNRRTATWNLFVLYNKKLKYTERMPFYFKFRHFDRHENSTAEMPTSEDLKSGDFSFTAAPPPNRTTPPLPKKKEMRPPPHQIDLHAPKST